MWLNIDQLIFNILFTHGSSVRFASVRQKELYVSYLITALIKHPNWKRSKAKTRINISENKDKSENKNKHYKKMFTDKVKNSGNGISRFILKSAALRGPNISK